MRPNKARDPEKHRTGGRPMPKRNAFRLYSRHSILIAALAIGTIAVAGPAKAASPTPPPFSILLPQPAPSYQSNQALSYQPAEPQAVAPSDRDRTTYELPARLRRQVVSYASREAAGTVIIDTPNTFLYYVLGNGQALRYGIGVGRDGFTWSGVQSVTRKAEWPDWTPPPEMIARQPYLPRQMAGGPGNPLGARAMYLGGTVYRIHGTNAPETIGTHVSSGCIRLTNADVIDLYSRVTVGAKVIVLPMERRAELGGVTRER
jgi:lipoprotein-anchoring transpeptidase ErfK/SrfK